MKSADPEQWIHVDFPGHGTFWVKRCGLDGTGDSPLAPEHHIRDGKLDFPACFDGDSYAHVFPEAIKRYHRVIGSRFDLRPIAADRPAGAV